MAQQSVEPGTAAEDAGEGSLVPAGRSWLDRYFHISGRGSTVAREVRGGITTFMAMSYILLLNPLILSGKDAAGDTLGQKALITATAFAAAFTTLLMGLVGKAPLALAAGLSVSGVLSSQVAPAMTWPQAMGMCVVYGVVIMLLVVTGLREMIMNAIPLALKHGITMGIGLFIALIGFYKSGFVHQGKATPLALGPAGELAGWPVLLFAGTLLLIFMLQARNVPGAILIGIVSGTVVAAVLSGLGVIDAGQWAGGAPELHGSAVSPPDFSLFGHVGFGGWGEVGAMTIGVIVFTLVLAGFFDAMATIIGVGTEAGLADAKGR
ncbi:solute carrier family 23 protein, partial [Streptomyces olivaceoviridis]